MSENIIRKIEITACIAACILGVLFHFVYDWTGKNPAAAAFFPVNESTWEHLKLVFFPIMILSFGEYFFLQPSQRERFWQAKLVSALTGMALTVILFYTYTGVYGKNVDFLNIMLYFLSMAAAYVLSYSWINSGRKGILPESVSYVCFLLLILVFAIFTFYPPDIGLFREP